MKTKGFSVVELLVVLAIMAVLVALAYPSLLYYVRQARLYDAQQALLDNARGLEKHYALKYSFKRNSTTWADLAITDTGHFCLKMQGQARGSLGDRYTIKAVAYDKNTEPRVILITHNHQISVCEQSDSTCDETPVFSAVARVDKNCRVL